MQKRLSGLLVFALAILLVTSFVSLAQTNSEQKIVNVPSEFATIQEAVDAASDNTTILISTGYYSDFTVAGKSNLVIRAAGDPSKTVIKGTVKVKNSQGIRFEGLTVTGSGDGLQVLGKVEKLSITGCLLVGNEGSGINFLGSSVYSDVEISDNEMNNNGRDGIDFHGKGTGFVVKNNEISSNGQETSTGVGIRIGGDVSQGLVEDNWIVDNPFAGIHPGS